MEILANGSGKSRAESKRKPNLLFVASDFPAPTGGGTPMRGAMTVRALARDFNIRLLVLPTWRDDRIERVARPILDLCAEVAVGRPAERMNQIPAEEDFSDFGPYPRTTYRRSPTPGRIPDCSDIFGGVKFEALYVQKIFLAPFVEKLLADGSGPRLWRCLDLDDYESLTRKRIAALYVEAGEDPETASRRMEAEKLAAMERRFLPRFDRVFVCSELDRRKLSRDYGCDNVAVLPNGVDIPVRAPARKRNDRFTFLFVGSLRYYPNVDAAVYFVEQIAPRLRKRARKPFQLLIAGRGVDERVKALEATPDVEVAGWAPSVEAWYARADAAIVPIRAGGGTRIKILEAFGRRVPVVSTAIGAEGLDVRHGEELLIGDDPDRFAGHCLELMEDPELGRKMARRAYSWVKSQHSFDCFLAALTSSRRPRGGNFDGSMLRSERASPRLVRSG